MEDQEDAPGEETSPFRAKLPLLFSLISQIYQLTKGLGFWKPLPPLKTPPEKCTTNKGYLKDVAFGDLRHLSRHHQGHRHTIKDS